MRTGRNAYSHELALHGMLHGAGRLFSGGTRWTAVALVTVLVAEVGVGGGAVRWRKPEDWRYRVFEAAGGAECPEEGPRLTD